MPLFTRVYRINTCCLRAGAYLGLFRLDSRYWRLITFFAAGQVPPGFQLVHAGAGWPWMSDVMFSMN